MIETNIDGRIAEITLGRGDGKNALSLELLRELLATLRSLEENDSLSAVILTAQGPNFSVGFDLTCPEMADLLLTGAGAGARRRQARLGPRVCQTIEDLEPVVIAAVEGHCIGGGVALAAACDLIVAGEGARFMLPEIDRGMNLSWGAVPRLINLVGPAWAKRFIITGEAWTAAQAFERGLAQELAMAGDALSRARALARTIADKPPLAVRLIKQGANAYANALSGLAADAKGDQFALATFSDDFREGIASFLERRQPRFTGG